MAGPKNTVAWHRNPLIRGLIAQALLIAVVVWGITTIYANTVANMEARGIQIGFGFLSEVAPFGIAFSPFIDFNLGESTYLTVFFIGIQNTIIVSIFGIIAATILGFSVGIMRLSPNWFVSKIATVYIETFRNIPVLLQIMFWNFAVFLPLLPYPKQSLGGGGFFLNNRGAYLPKPVVENATANTAFWAAIIIGIIAMYILHKFAHNRQERTGKTMPGKLIGFGIMAALVALAAMVFGGPFGFDAPVLGRFNLTGGIEIPLPLFALWFSLTTYTAAFIAENVRGGIEAVTKGQWEAAGALGLSRSHLLKLVIIPQAMRIIVPPTISQYLNPDQELVTGHRHCL